MLVKFGGGDLEIQDQDKYSYILTYSFPCQDLSLAGLRKGMDQESGTRSSLLWEVKRILQECYELRTLPDVLLMENVPQVHGIGNAENFKLWQLELEKLGYESYWKDLIATDYGIPQIRNRTFMVSVKKGNSYKFPKKIKLEKKLKDALENEVDESYYLSDSMINYIYGNENAGKYNRLAARESADRCIEKGLAVTLSTNMSRPTDNFIKVKNKTKKGYLEAEEGDGINISPRMKHQRGNVQKDKSQTLTTMGGEAIGVVVDE